MMTVEDEYNAARIRDISSILGMAQSSHSA